METNTEVSTARRPPRNGNSTYCERLAAFFKTYPGEWLDGRQLARIGGSYAWRTRTAELRRVPFAMRIDNRQRRVDRGDGTKVTVSEYRYVDRIEATA